jgi:hypothetical protein
MRSLNAEVEPTNSHSHDLPAITYPAALPAGTVTTNPDLAGRPSAPHGGTKKGAGGRKKRSDGSQSEAAAARRIQITGIIAAQAFDDFERYSAALGKKGVAYQDHAALVVRLAQTKFNIAEGLTTTEILEILRDRFSINRDRKSMERVLRDSPRTFFSVSPAPFHHKAKFYRPMKDCIDRVDELLKEFDHTRIVPVNSGANAGDVIN